MQLLSLSCVICISGEPRRYTQRASEEDREKKTEEGSGGIQFDRERVRGEGEEGAEEYKKRGRQRGGGKTLSSGNPYDRVHSGDVKVGEIGKEKQNNTGGKKWGGNRDLEPRERARMREKEREKHNRYETDLLLNGANGFVQGCLFCCNLYECGGLQHHCLGTTWGAACLFLHALKTQGVHPPPLSLTPINGLPPLHPGLTPCLSRALWQPALMTDNVCNYQPNSHKELMKNQAGRSSPHLGPLVPPHSLWMAVGSKWSLIGRRRRRYTCGADSH